ncbi:MAG: acyl-CoA synthetase [Porticoccaceae bacterium]|nr:acyl-CoA synthetase [Porticoccaceae bacterium]
MNEQAFPSITQGNNKVALFDASGSYTYDQISARIDIFAKGLIGVEQDLREERVAFLIGASLDYVTALHGVWRAGGIAVPLNVSSSTIELDHYLRNAGVTRMVAPAEHHDKLSKLCGKLNVSLLTVDDVLSQPGSALPNFSSKRSAMILFTSGTTNKPKGVVITHKAIKAQILTLLDAWRWSDKDVIPLFLPLHHIHGIINVLSCALWSGATVHLLPKLDMNTICSKVIEDSYSVFMAVPTIYVKLIDHLAALNSSQAQAICDGFRRMRLNVSGSAACPVNVFDKWQGLTGQILLERYGMTEVGMGISNPYEGKRRAGYVGQPLPGVTVQLFDEEDNRITHESVPGEIRMQGDNLFKEYWNNPRATEEAFKDGWFCSGDIAVIEDGYLRIMGRSSIDIIKSGGYKLSALEIEGVLLTHEAISEAAVIGVADDTWGEAVAAFLCLRPGTQLDYSELKDWCSNRMSAYKIPKQIKILDSLPRNAMGKVTKPSLKL